MRVQAFGLGAVERVERVLRMVPVCLSIGLDAATIDLVEASIMKWRDCSK